MAGAFCARGLSVAALTTILLWSTSAPAPARPPAVYHIPSLMVSGTGVSGALGISADGVFVVGAAASPRSSNGAEAYRWSIAGGIEPLGDLPGGNFNSFATSASGNGAIVTGLAEPSGLNTAAFKWTSPTGMVALPAPPDLGGGGIGYGVSSTGSVIVGSSNNLACYWLNGTGHSIPRFDASHSFSEARAISNDGSIIAGHEGTGGTTAFVWTEAGGTVALPDIPGGVNFTIVGGISGDGHSVLGASRNGNPRPVRWLDGVPQALAGPSVLGVARDSTFDGSIIVGNITPGDAGAFIWDSGHGYRNLTAALLTDYGLVADFGTVAGMSDDGLVIAGTDHAGVGLVVVLPEPSTAMTIILIAVSLLPGGRARALTGSR